MSVGKTLAGVALGMGGYWLARLVFDVPFESMVPAFLAMAFALLVGCVIGYPVGYFISRDGDVDGAAFRVFAWANLGAWIIPVLGTTLSALTYMMSRRSDDRHTSYYVLSTVGGLLAMAHAAWGGVSAHDEAQRVARVESITGADVNAPRSRERCPYAAHEGWSIEDVDIYCR